MRRLVAVAALVLSGCGSGGDYDAFRSAYVESATYGDEFAERPPTLTDAQIDAAIETVCVDGEPDADRAEPIGRSLAGGPMGSTGLQYAVVEGVRAVGCP